MTRRIGARLIGTAAIGIASTFALVCAASALATRAGDERSEMTKALAGAKVTLAKAVETARQQVKDGTAVKVSLDDERPRWEVKFIVGDVVRAVDIDASTGAVLGTSDSTMTDERKKAVAEIKPLLASAKSDPVKAAEAATARVSGGKAFEVEPDVEGGKLVYGVTLLAGDKIMRAEVDAATGVVGTVAEARDNDDDEATAITFDKDAAGTLPDGWKAEGTNQKGPVATWLVMADPTAPSAPNVLALSKINHDSGGTFNICWTDRVRFKDGEIEVRFKANSGQEDQGGGLIWRVKDKDNYYIARMNPLEDNFRVYYVKDGARKQLATEKVRVPAGEWHAMRIEHRGDHIECYLDGKKYLDVRDSTLPGEGGIGLWTKADAISSFDDLRVEAGGGEEHRDAAAGAPKKSDDKDDDDDDDDKKK